MGRQLVPSAQFGVADVFHVRSAKQARDNFIGRALEVMRNRRRVAFVVTRGSAL